jgi:hypothetical protein
MKEHIPTFSKFINENLDDSATENRHRDTMVYLIPRAYRIKVELSPEYIGAESQSRSEGRLTSKFAMFKQDKLMFNKSHGVNIVGNIAYLKLKTVFPEDFLERLIETLFDEAIGGEINIEETPTEEFSNGKWYW